MSITYKELLGSHAIAEVPILHQHNLEDLLKKINFIPVKYNLYCEDGTIGWIHFQTVSPKSGKQWFLP